MQQAELDEFVRLYQPAKRLTRKATFSETNPPDVIAAEIIEDLQAALDQLKELEANSPSGAS